MKSLTKYISRMKDLHSLNEYLTEKLIINKEYKSLSDDFCDKFEDDIEYILTKIDTMKMDNDIEKALEETFYDKHKRLIMLDAIEKEKLFNSENKIFVAKGFVDVNSFYYEIFLKMSAYCEQHKNDKWLRYCEKEGHYSIYVLNTYKYYLVIGGDDRQNERFSSSIIVIQEK